MYPALLTIHSWVRWLVLLSLIISIFLAYRGWLSNKRFTKRDNAFRHWTATFTHIQLLLGLWLYFISPITNYFLQYFNDAIHQREIRFFGMEHSLMMFIAVVIITIGSAKAKRKSTDAEKFKTMAVWFSIGLFVILTSIPWWFSPLVSRPFIRLF